MLESKSALLMVLQHVFVWRTVESRGDFLRETLQHRCVCGFFIHYLYLIDCAYCPLVSYELHVRYHTGTCARIRMHAIPKLKEVDRWTEKRSMFGVYDNIGILGE